VIQNDTGNRYAATTIVAIITSTVKPYPFTVALDAGEGGLRRASMVNLAHVLTIDEARLRHRLGRLGEERMRAVDMAPRVSLGL
jgi:mRNA interferase MazF